MPTESGQLQSGIKVDRLRVASFAATGLIAALAGVLYAGTTGGADPSSGLSFLLPAYAAVFLGATAIIPGHFNAIGTFVAVYVLIAGITGLAILGIQTYVQSLFYGTALVVAVSLEKIFSRRSNRSQT